MLEKIDKAIGNFIDILSGNSNKIGAQAKELSTSAVQYFGESKCMELYTNILVAVVLLLLGSFFITITHNLFKKIGEDSIKDKLIEPAIVFSSIFGIGILILGINISINALKDMPKTKAACDNPKGALVYQIVTKYK